MYIEEEKKRSYCVKFHLIFFFGLVLYLLLVSCTTGTVVDSYYVPSGTTSCTRANLYQTVPSTTTPAVPGTIKQYGF